MEKRQIGIACWGLRELVLEEQLSLSKRLGGDYMELGIANAPKDLPLSASAETLMHVRRLFEKYQLPLIYAATGNDFTFSSAKQVSEQVEKVKTVIRICGKLQIRYLRIFAGFSPADEVTGMRFDVMADALQQSSAYARQHDVCLAIELHGGVITHNIGVEHFHSVTTRRDKLEELLHILPDDVGFVLDPANLWAVGITEPEQYYERLAGRIAYIHLKDFRPLPSGFIMPSECGTGEMNWRRFFDSVGDFFAPFFIEYENPGNVEQGMAGSIRYINSILDEYQA